MLYGMANLQYVKILVADGLIQDAARQIFQEPNENTAEGYYAFLLNNYHVALWDAFLNNHKLKAYLTPAKLLNIFSFLCFFLSDTGKYDERRQNMQDIILRLNEDEDLLATVKTSFTLEQKKEYIQYYIDLKLNGIAKKWIILDENLQEEFRPFLYQQLCQCFDPIVACACLKNMRFKTQITFNDIHWMIKKALLALEKEQEQKNKGIPIDKKMRDSLAFYEEILVLIAQNDDWCRMYCYANFIALANVSPKLADYITSTPSFLIHLEPYHVGVLAGAFPHLQSQIIRLVKTLTFENKDRVSWAVLSLKAIYAKIGEESDTYEDDKLLLEFNCLVISKPQKAHASKKEIPIDNRQVKSLSQANSFS